MQAGSGHLLLSDEKTAVYPDTTQGLGTVLSILYGLTHLVIMTTTGVYITIIPIFG